MLPAILPVIIGNLANIALGVVGDKVKNAEVIAFKKAEAELEKKLEDLKHQNGLEELREKQRHELQIKLLSVLEKISQLDLSSPEQLAACQQLMKVAVALGSNNYEEEIEKITSTPRNITPDIQTLTVPTLSPIPSVSLPPVSSSTSPIDNLISAVGIDYTKLRDLLAVGKWKEADEETARAMLKVAGREKEVLLRTDDIDKFPCKDLCTIDQLWVKYSDEQFGFSVQKHIYQSLGGTRYYNQKICEAFGDRIGWRVNNRWLLYSDLTFSLDSLTPAGHLPFSVCSRGNCWNGVVWFSSFVEKLVDCNS